MFPVSFSRTSARMYSISGQQEMTGEVDWSGDWGPGIGDKGRRERKSWVRIPQPANFFFFFFFLSLRITPQKTKPLFFYLPHKINPL